MRWWQFGIYASVAWAVVVAVIAGGLLWQISSHPMGEQIDERRMKKAGEAAGMLLGAGLSAIWGYAVFRLKKKTIA